MVAHEFGQSQPGNLLFVGEPTCLDKPFDFLGELVRDLYLYFQSLHGDLLVERF